MSSLKFALLLGPMTFVKGFRRNLLTRSYDERTMFSVFGGRSTYSPGDGHVEDDHPLKLPSPALLAPSGVEAWP